MKKNLLTNISEWGPTFWRMIHTIGFTYPGISQANQYKAFFDSLLDVLPCPSCKEHLQENYSQIPIDLTSMEALSRWTVDLHNQVNLSTGKPILEYEDVARQYLTPSQLDELGIEPRSQKTFLYVLLLLGLLIAFVILAFWFFRKRVQKN